MRLPALLLAGLCVAGQAHAGLFSDDEARNQAQQLDVRTSKLEEAGKAQSENNRQQAEINVQQAEINKQQAEINKQQTHSMLDLQAQIDALNTELRRVRGQNEELLHSLQDAEKRQKDFYIDLDTRIRHFEAIEAAAPPPPPPVPAGASAPVAPVASDEQAAKVADGKAVKTEDPAVENRAYEAAYGLLKAGKDQEAVKAYQEFLKKFPESVHVPNAHYGIATAYFALKDCKNALASYQVLVNKYAFSPKVPDAMLNMAECQRELKAVVTARKTLTQIVSKYPGSEAADKARKRLATFK